MGIKHSFISAKADGADTGLVRPSDWNAEHVIDDGSVALSKLASDTTTAVGVGSVELGHASDTTLTRAFAGRLAVEGVNVVTTSSTDTLTNKTISGSNNTISNIAQSSVTNLTTDLAGKVAANSAITGATKTKITYDSKGLVTAGADATTADIADSTNKRYVTDAQQTVLTNTSGTNTGDQLVFKTIAVSGQSDVVADTATDTVTFASSGNLSITTNATTDTVTFTGTEPTQAFIIPCSDETTALTTGTAKATFRMPYGFVLSDIRASLSTAQASGNIFTVDVNANGTSVLTTKLTVDNGEKTSVTAATPKVVSAYGIIDDAEVTVDIDQIGDSTAKGLKVNLVGYRHAATPLLDTYGGAAAAYSVRKLKSSYTGSALRVRRSSDNTEQDIGFDSSGNLDESALTTFVGSGSGYVTKWYDQSGNTRDASQTTQANQPRIVDAGTVEKRNSDISLFFDGSNDSLASTYSFSSAFTAFGVVNVAGTTSADRIGVYHNNVFEIGLQATSSWGIQVVSDLAAVVTISPSVAQATTQILSLTSGNSYLIVGNWNGNSSVVKYRRNGSAATDSGTSGSTLRSGTSGTAYYTGYASEFIIYGSDKMSDASAIEFDINNYYSIY